MARGWKSIVVAAVMLLLPATASAAPPPVGGLTQLPGRLGCFATVPSASCQLGTAVAGAESVVISPDGRYVYVGSYPGASGSWRIPSLTVFSRDLGTGQLTQLPGTAGCLTPDGSSQTGPNTCTKVEGLGPGDGRDFVITSDGQWAYMANQGNVGGEPPASIVIFKRDPATGVLTQPAAPDGCISQTGDSQDGPSMCQTLSTIRGPVGISLSPDNRFLYVTDIQGEAVHVLARDGATGGLTETQCLSASLTPPSGCLPAREIGDAQSVVISPDGLHAYTAEFGFGLSIFDRDPSTGALTQKALTAGCISDDGNDNTATPTCATARVVHGAYSITISPDQHTLYVTAWFDNGLAIFHINSDGTLTQLSGSAGCITLTGGDNTGSLTCTAGRALEGPYGVAVSPDGRTLYVTELTSGATEGGVAMFSLDATSGAATQLPGAAGCLTVDGASNGVSNACGFGAALAATYQPIVSPDGRFVYIASQGGQSVTVFSRETGPVCDPVSNPQTAVYPRSVTVSLTCMDPDGDPLTRSIVTGTAHGTLGAIDQSTGTVTYTPAPGYQGTDTFTFAASDGTNTSAPVTAQVFLAQPPTSITHVRQSHRTWREGNKLAKVSAKHKRRPPVGTTFSFALNETARVTFTFRQRLPGRKVNGKCVAVTKRNQKKGKCTRTVTRGTITFTGHVGTNRVAFQGRLNRHHKLKPGTYTLTIGARALSGVAQAKRLTFTIVK